MVSGMEEIDFFATRGAPVGGGEEIMLALRIAGEEKGGALFNVAWLSRMPSVHSTLNPHRP